MRTTTIKTAGSSIKTAGSSIKPATWTRRAACTAGPGVRVGIVGAGLAGLATCYELLRGLDQQQQQQQQEAGRVEIQVMDRHGIAAG